VKNPIAMDWLQNQEKIDLVYNRCSDDFQVKQLWILIHDQMWGTASDHTELTILLKNKNTSCL
jgi:hypothetical protein